MRTNLKLNIILAMIGVALVSVFLDGPLDAQVLSNKIIEVESNSPQQSWNLVDKLVEKEDLLKELHLEVSSKSLNFYENRFSQNGTKISVSKKKLSEQNKDIGLKIMNKDTGEVRVIKISIRVQKDGIQVISPEGYQIKIVERPSGIRWNRWNTLYEIVSPGGWFVLKNKYPDINETTQKVTVKDKNGKNKVITKKIYVTEEFIYSPYGESLHTPELIETGRGYLKSIVQEALVDLKEKKVYSKALPNVLVADISAWSPTFFGRLPLLEHTDMVEFVANPKKSVERVLVLIGANQNVAFSKTGSKAGALGWVQYTSKTYNAIRKAYPAAKLIQDFEIAAGSHLNSMEAAILLYDYNLKPLVDKKGKNVINDPRLEEYLAASYNGNPKWVLQSLKASVFGSLNWPTKLKTETKGYLYKIRYLQENDWP
jgi:hypothetical protein